jgi:tetratricopeptide (TPR) repeat protein
VSPTCQLVIALLALPALAQDNVRQLYERARLLQERNSRHEEAIRIYGRVVELAKNDRALAARAQLGHGLLDLRLGQHAEAQQAFRKVVTDFSEPRVLAQPRCSQARGWLMA